MKTVSAVDDLFHQMNRELEQEGEGIRHFKRLLFGHSVEYLLLYDEGKLRGIAQYVPKDIRFADLPDMPPGLENELAEKAGNLNIAVHPAHRRKGFGTRLLWKAQERWSVNLNDQSYTPDGKALVKHPAAVELEKTLGRIEPKLRGGGMSLWYHFTDRSNLVGILKEGLKPRGDRPANYHGDELDSNPAYVYLTERMTRPWHGMDYSRMAVLAIDDNWLDESLKREDEDKEKFSTVGTIAYEGVIHSDAIEDIWFYDPRVDDRGVLSYVMVRQDFRGWDGIWD